VLDAIAEKAALVCSTENATVWLVEGEELSRSAQFGSLYSALDRLPIDHGSRAGEAVVERRTIHIDDVQLGHAAHFAAVDAAATGGTILVTPMLRENAAIGAITLRRGEVRPFTDR